MASRPLTLADGQLASSSTTVLSGANAPSGRVNVVLSNTGTAEETIIFTVSVAGGTARRVARIVLDENEQAVLRNVSLQGDDTLAGYTTTASVVDYVVVSSNSGAFAIDVLDERGASRGTEVLRKMLRGIEMMAVGGDELPDLG